eukprot:COSAG04_NODE_3406_length_2843_cov_4.018222_1_plen_72_part_10
MPSWGRVRGPRAEWAATFNDPLEKARAAKGADAALEARRAAKVAMDALAHSPEVAAVQAEACQALADVATDP